MLIGDILIMHDMTKVIRIQTKIYLNLINFQMLSMLINLYKRNFLHEIIFYEISINRHISLQSFSITFSST